MTLEDQIEIATIEFENYAFGEGVMITDHDGWNTDDSQDFTKVAYAECDGANETQKLSFHAHFDSRGEFIDAYALDCETGNEIGCRGDFGASA